MLSQVLFLCCIADNNKKRRLYESKQYVFLLLVLAFDTAPSHHPFPIYFA